jgi:integrase
VGAVLESGTYPAAIPEGSLLMAEKRITVWVQQFKDRPNLMLQWIDPDTGDRKSKSAGTTDPDAAEKKRADLEYELNHGINSEPSKMPWETFRQLYEEEKLAGSREATRKKAGYVFDSFAELARPRTLGTVSERTISKYAVSLREKGYKPATIQGHLAYLRAALRWAADQKFIPMAPKVVMPKVPKKKIIRKIVAEEFERLTAKAPTAHWQAFIATAWFTGMRRNEMLDLTWGNPDMPRIDFAENRIWIPAAYNKSDADQWLPMHPELVEILQALPDKQGFLFPFRNAPREVSRKFTKLARSLGLKISLHDLRRSFGSRYAAVVPAPVLQRLMRHADIKTTLAYYTNVDDVLEDAILKA